jgi:hypothetical protein
VEAEEKLGSPAAIKLSNEIKKEETEKALLDKGLFEFNSNGVVEVIKEDKTE